MEKHLAEEKGLKIGLSNVSVGAGASAGARIGLSEQSRVAIVVQFAAAASDLNVALQQHDAASGGNSKVLSISNHYYVKKDAETSFTKVEVDPAADNYDINPGNVEGIAVFEVLQEDLDVAGDFSHISADLTGTATARACSVLYVGKAELLPAYERNL
jgi:hypothetical protein